MAQNNLSNPKNHQHAILIPYPLQGHLIPFVNLALKLASKGFTITFVNTQSVHHKITKAQNSSLDRPSQDMFFEARKLGFDIRYVTVSDGFPLAFDRMANEDQFWEGILNVFPAHIDELVGELVQSSHPRVTCLIADTFYTWGSSISKKHGISHCTFWTEPLIVFTLYYHWDLLWENGHFGSKENRKDAITYIPGVPEIKPTDLMSFLQDVDISTIVHRIIDKAFKDVKKADFILSNTVQEFECDTSSAIESKQPFYSIGPVFAPARLANTSIKTSLWHESDCNRWLDTKANESVLYVSFGSYAHVSKEELVEIAHGLVLSKVNFLWVLRDDIVSSNDQNENILPDGFIEDVKHQGLIVPWCSQMDVLSHSAVGGFLTHCGWNSILESIKCCVPLLCYPLMTDQFTNRKLVVDDWRIGFDLCYEKLITRDQVSTRIKLLMDEKVGEELRSQIKEYKVVMENASAGDGSSCLNMDRFIEHLCNLN